MTKAQAPKTSKTKGKQKKQAATIESTECFVRVTQADLLLDNQCLQGKCVEGVMEEAFSRASTASFCDQDDFFCEHSHHPNYVETTTDYNDYLKRVRGTDWEVGDVTRLAFDDGSTLHIVYPGLYYGSPAGNEKAANALDEALLAVFGPLHEYQKTLPENNTFTHAGCDIADLRERLNPTEFDLHSNWDGVRSYLHKHQRLVSVGLLEGGEVETE